MAWKVHSCSCVIQKYPCILRSKQALSGQISISRFYNTNFTRYYSSITRLKTLDYRIDSGFFNNFSQYGFAESVRGTFNDSYFHKNRSILTRTFVTANSKDGKSKQNTTNETQEEKFNTQQTEHKSLLRRFKIIVDVFWIGCKALFRDVRLALQTRRKLGLYHQRDFAKLSREELRHMRQTKQDVVKTFPVAFLFMVPFIGYIAPLIAYFYPKQLLSQQFWHPDQKKEFVLEEYEKRSQYYLPLVKEVGVTCKEINNKALLRLCLDTLDGKHPTNAELLQFKNDFSTIEDLSIQKMPRYHLVKICKCWLIPTAWYLPRWFLMNALRRRISRLHDDDVLLARDGVDILTPECLEQAVHVRGLDEASLYDQSKYHWLQQWVTLSTKVSGEDVSFLTHCAVFKAANFEEIEKLNGTVESKN